MQISKIDITNFRLLKDVSIEIEKEQTLIVGKNNTAKTSLISLIEKFINGNDFEAEDFNIEYLIKKNEEIENNIENNIENFNMNISMKFEITYDKNDKLNVISNFITNLEASENKQILSFIYSLKNDIDNKQSFLKAIKEHKDENKDFNLLSFLKEDNILKTYFEKEYFTIDPNDENNFNKIIIDEIKKLIKIETIHATRDLSSSNESKKPKYSLSKQISSLFEKDDDDELHEEKEKIKKEIKIIVEN